MMGVFSFSPETKKKKGKGYTCPHLFSADEKAP